MPPCPSLPTELWHLISGIISGRISRRVRARIHRDTWSHTLRALSLVSHTLRSTSQPLLFDMLSVSSTTALERIQGLKEMLGRRGGSASWFKYFEIRNGLPGDIFAIVSVLFLQLDRLQSVKINNQIITQQMLAHILRLPILQHLTYRPNGLPFSFNASAFHNIEVTTHELAINRISWPDCQVILGQSPRLRKLNLRGLDLLILGKSDAHPLLIMPSRHQINTLTIQLSQDPNLNDILDFSGVFSNVEDLEIKIICLNSYQLLNAADLRIWYLKYQYLFPRLRKICAHIAIALTLVPSRPITDLWFNGPWNRELPEETWRTLSRGSVELEILSVGSCCWHEDLLKHIAEYFPALSSLSLSLPSLPTHLVVDYLLDLGRPLPRQIQHFSCWSTVHQERYRPFGEDRAKAIQKVRPSLKSLRIQTWEAWPRDETIGDG